MRQLEYQEALKILGCRPGASLDQITSQYRVKVKLAHPDHGGSTEWFQDIRNAYKTILDQYKYKHKVQDQESGEWEDQETELPEGLKKKIMEVLEKVANPGVSVSVLGTWIWLTGETYSIRVKVHIPDRKYT